MLRGHATVVAVCSIGVWIFEVLALASVVRSFGVSLSPPESLMLLGLATGYYMAWFFGLGLPIFTPIAAYIAWPQVQGWWSTLPTRVLRLGLVASVSFVAALSIFAAIYGPVLATGATRGFGEYLIFAPTPVDLVNVGSQNLVWSGLVRSLHLIRDNRLDDGEVSVALTPVVQILLASSAALAFRPGFWPAGDVGRISRAFVIAGASVCALFFLLTIKVHNNSLFHILHAMVPGAKAIRVGYRGMVVANLFAVTAIGLTFDQVVRLSSREPRTSLRLGRLGVLTALLSLAAIQQVNLAQPAILSRNFQRQHLAAVGTSPRECRAFYAAPQRDRNPYEVQIDAMMVVQARHLPTINGYSGLDPPGRDFYNTHAADYEQRAMRWAANRGIAAGLCGVDIERGTWSRSQRLPFDRGPRGHLACERPFLRPAGLLPFEMLPLAFGNLPVISSPLCRRSGPFN